MSSSAKVFYLTNGEYMNLDQIHVYLNMFHDDTQLIPNVIKISRNRYTEFSRMNGPYTQTLETGKKYALYFNSAFGFIPVIPVSEEKMCPGGFISVEDTEFDEKFEAIVLKDDKA